VSPRVRTGRRRGALAAAALASLLVAACGDDAAGDDATDDGAALGAESGDAPAPADPGGGSNLTVEARDIEFDSDAYLTAAGPVDIEYRQQGALPHSLVIEDADGGAVDGFRLEVGDADADRGTADLPPGEYVLYCDLPGHRDAGMEAELRVD
jgi:uncharacterized cupredoxin-like copper-binding protein